MLPAAQVSSPVPDASISSSRTVAETEPMSPLHLPRRQSSIRFSSGTRGHRQTSLSPVSFRNRRPSNSDETTPIRTSSHDKNRHYQSDYVGEAGDTAGRPAPKSDDSDEEEDDHLTANAASPSNRNSQSAVARARTNSSAESTAAEKQPWYQRVARKYGHISLDNKGSVARDHLALERTFLAWLRTSLAFASIGIAITQLFRLNTSTAPPSKRLTLESILQPNAEGRLPLSPLLGHSLSLEVLQQLQQYVASPEVTLGPTLLDQLLYTGDLANTQQSSTSDPAAHLRRLGKPLGSTFLAISIVVLITGFHRYFESQHWIIRGKFPASRGSVTLVAMLAFALMLASFIIVLVVAPSKYEK